MKWFNRDHLFSERSIHTKIQRVIYKFSRMIYVGFDYYFSPVFFLFVQQTLLVLVNYDDQMRMII